VTSPQCPRRPDRRLAVDGSEPAQLVHGAVGVLLGASSGEDSVGAHEGEASAAAGTNVCDVDDVDDVDQSGVRGQAGSLERVTNLTARHEQHVTAAAEHPVQPGRAFVGVDIDVRESLPRLRSTAVALCLDERLPGS
jgi:hypothetical protein